MKRNVIAWAALVVSSAALIGSQNWSRTVPASPAQEIPQEGLAEAKALSRAFQTVAEYVGPSVVQVSVQRTPDLGQRGIPRGPGGQPMTPEDLEEFMERFREFFPQGPAIPEGYFRLEPQQFQVEGTGSGFVYDDTGHILTNNHVVEGANGDGDIEVTFQDGSTAEAKVIGTDPATDVAVIKVDPSKVDRSLLTPARIGSSDDLHVGQWVLAIGSPFGFSQTVTAGIISATNRSAVGILGETGYEDFIQTDAAINPGNSGGPLIDIEGRVIGINSAIATRSRGNVGVGFAIPIDMATYVADALIEEGRVQRALLGVRISPLDRERAEVFGYDPNTKGIVVEEVMPGTPAAKAGLKAGDIIVGYRGDPIDRMQDFRLDIATSKIGQPFELTYLRDGQEQTTEVVLAPQPQREIPPVAGRGPSEPDGPEQEAPEVELERFGLGLQELTADLADQLGFDENTQGVLVRSVSPDSPAAQNGIQAGDLITKVVKDKKIQNVEDLDSFMDIARNTDELAIYVQSSEGVSRFVALKAEDGA